MRRAAYFILCILGAGSFFPRNGFAAKAEWKILPGPTSMSETEKAILPDPASGMEHGVILIEETEQDDTLGTDTQVSYHFRAKILSNGGRALGDIEIPYFEAKSGFIRQFWANSIAPDGAVTVMKQEDLKPQMVIKTNGQEFQALKGIVPGIVPGCVLDIGWVIWRQGVEAWTRFELEREWPVREWRYRWKPYLGWRPTVRTTRTETLEFTLDQRRDVLAMSGRNFPAVPEEPWMPSRDAVRAIANLYYPSSTASLDPEVFWREEAKDTDRRARAFSQDKAVKAAIAQMKLPEGADLGTKLRVAYDWLSTNVRNTARMALEDEERITDRKRLLETREKRSMSEMLEAREALPWQMDYAYMAIAAALGAETHMVLTTNRTDRYWDPGLLTKSQLNWTLVAVRAPGEPDEKAVFADTGSGLPFGEFPWMVSGSKGILMTSKGYREISLWPSEIEKNVRETKAKVGFADGVMRAEWTVSGKGQQGYTERLRLRRMTPEDRAKRIEDLCGAGGAFEIAKAESPKIATDLTAGFELSCEGESSEVFPDESLDRWAMKVDGPWMYDVASFAAAERKHPIVFDFPKIDRTIMMIEAPPGFEPVAAPAPIHIEERWGRYTMKFAPAKNGYEVEREFLFGPLLVKQPEYAALREFLQSIRKADQAEVEFRKAEVAP